MAFYQTGITKLSEDEQILDNTPEKILGLDANNRVTVSDANILVGNFIKIDPSPDTDQTFIGDLKTRGTFEAFAISGSKTELTSQGIRFTLTGSAFFGLLSPTTAFTANRAITLQDKDGVIAYLSDVILKEGQSSQNLQGSLVSDSSFRAVSSIIGDFNESEITAELISVGDTSEGVSTFHNKNSFGFGFGGSGFNLLIKSDAPTSDKEVLFRDLAGTIALLSDIEDLSDNVIHTTGDEVKNGNLQILKNAGEGTARLWVQSENGIASLRLQNGTNSAQAGAVYQDTSGNFVLQNGRPGGWLDLTVTEPGGITSSAIKATPISQDVSAIELSGRVKIFDGVDNDEAASIGQLATKANLTGGNSFTGDQNVNGNVIFPNNKGIGFSGQIAMLYDSGVSAFRVFYAQTGDDVFTINPTTQETTFIKPLVVPNAVNTDEAVNLGQLQAAGKIKTTSSVTANTVINLATATSYRLNTGVTTVTLPVLTGNSGTILFLINNSGGNITINSNAGANDIWSGGAIVNTETLTTSTIMRILHDGTQWSIL